MPLGLHNYCFKKLRHLKLLGTSKVQCSLGKGHMSTWHTVQMEL